MADSSVDAPDVPVPQTEDTGTAPADTSGAADQASPPEGVSYHQTILHVKEAMENFRSLVQERDDLAGQVAELRLITEAGAVSATIQDLQGRLERLRGQLDTLYQERIDLQQQLTEQTSQAQHQLQHYQDRITDLERGRSGLVQYMGYVEKQRDSLQQERDSLQHQLGTTQQERDSLQQERDQLLAGQAPVSATVPTPSPPSPGQPTKHHS